MIAQIKKYHLTILIITIGLIKVVSASASLIQFQENTVILQEQLKCLQGKGYLDQTFIQVLNLFGNFQSSVLFDELSKVQITPHIFAISPDNVIPEATAGKWAKYLSNKIYKSIWFDISPAQGSKINCDTAWNFLSAVSALLKRQIGVYINQFEYKWPNDYNYLNSCYKLGIFPLFYENQQDFKAFANWSSYSLKMGKTIKNLCKVQQFKEILTQ